MSESHPNGVKPRRWFITGTDTGCGKTTVTAALARALVERGAEVACFKPIASGCRPADGRLVNDDALALMTASNAGLSYEEVNPYALEPAIAPHIAAERAGISFDLDAICRSIDQNQSAIQLVEGVGGWRVPLDNGLALPELPRRLDCPVLLVVGMRLGCLNHALLTAHAIVDDGLPLAGWIANFLDPAFAEPDANERTLERLLPAPRIGRMTPAAHGPRLWISDTLNPFDTGLRT
ncbi:MAG TPA: dethiobiotin synthase [Wenzhouxiangellaceae bacterium]|nr:dethiobiotin synthase [Wenzhouxiangellaceae bacterium]